MKWKQISGKSLLSQITHIFFVFWVVLPYSCKILVFLRRFYSSYWCHCSIRYQVFEAFGSKSWRHQVQLWCTNVNVAVFCMTPLMRILVIPIRSSPIESFFSLPFVHQLHILIYICIFQCFKASSVHTYLYNILISRLSFLNSEQGLLFWKIILLFQVLPARWPCTFQYICCAR